jgi:hypothetical protein
MDTIVYRSMVEDGWIPVWTGYDASHTDSVYENSLEDVFPLLVKMRKDTNTVMVSLKVHFDVGISKFISIRRLPGNRQSVNIMHGISSTLGKVRAASVPLAKKVVCMLCEELISTMGLS